MARTKASLGTGARLSDYLSVGLLGRVFPAQAVHDALNAHGVNTKRVRSLPALVTSYYCMAMSLYPDVAYEEVYAIVAQGMPQLGPHGLSKPVVKSAISAARARIGFEPLQTLCKSTCVPLAQSTAQPHAFYAGLRLVAMDGSNFDIPDESANTAQFGRPGSRQAASAFPQAKCAVLVECATHAILAAQLGPYKSSEWALCQGLLGTLGPDMLCLADRGFSGYGRWQEARATGAQLLWRCNSNRQLPVRQMLCDGSFLSEIYPKEVSRRTREDAIEVRVIEYTLPAAGACSGAWDAQGADAPTSGSGQSQSQPEPAPSKEPLRYRLITSMLDPVKAPAQELALLYHERWEVEAVFDELKTHLVNKRRTLRSKTPTGIKQEFYGWVMAHYAVCWLMHQTASVHRLRQRVLSFTGHANLLRRAFPQSGGFPP